MTNVPTIPNPNHPKGLPVNDLEGGAVYNIPVTITTNNQIDTGSALAVGGLQLTTAGVSDSTDKRFVTDTELSELSAMSAAGLGEVATELAAIGAQTGSESLLAGAVAIDLNLDTAQTLYTVPTGKHAIIIKIIFRNASVAPDTATFTFGYNSPTFDNVTGATQISDLLSSAMYADVRVQIGAAIGAPTNVLKLLCTIVQGGACTVNCDVFGYLY